MRNTSGLSGGRHVTKYSVRRSIQVLSDDPHSALLLSVAAWWRACMSENCIGHEAWRIHAGPDRVSEDLRGPMCQGTPLRKIDNILSMTGITWRQDTIGILKYPEISRVCCDYSFLSGNLSREISGYLARVRLMITWDILSRMSIRILSSPCKGGIAVELNYNYLTHAVFNVNGRGWLSPDYFTQGKFGKCSLTFSRR